MIENKYNRTSVLRSLWWTGCQPPFNPEKLQMFHWKPLCLLIIWAVTALPQSQNKCHWNVKEGRYCACTPKTEFPQSRQKGKVAWFENLSSQLLWISPDVKWYLRKCQFDRKPKLDLFRDRLCSVTLLDLNFNEHKQWVQIILHYKSTQLALCE